MSWLWLAALLSCADDAPVEAARAVAVPEALAAHCRDNIGPPRVVEVQPDVFLAIGYDLASTILIRTPEGNVVVDASMSPARAREVRAALDAVAPGPVKAVVYTHSHIDHIGGATVWVEPGTEVWATDRFVPHLFKQYGTFLAAEGARGARQFGDGVPEDALPCSALGRRPDVTAALDQGVVFPTRTFTGEARFEVGGVAFELREAHGETDDQLFVWLPDRRVLLPGDNWYRSFPNLYTIRGTQPRPVDAWIDSLDRMRALAPVALVPSHTAPLVGEDVVRDELTAYRDAIQWVRDEVVRGANAGRSVDDLAATIGLPAHLAARDALTERYGTLPWSVRALYANLLGWFDGKAPNLLPPADVARRTVDLAGGPDRVAAEARAAVAAEPEWAVHLVGLLDADGRLDASARDPLAADAYTALAERQGNTNARGYLLVAARERSSGVQPLARATLTDDFVAAIPVEHLFRVMASRLRPDAADVHERVDVRFTDLDRTARLVVRRGVLEVSWGAPMPGSPEPVATLITDAATWRRLAVAEQSRAGALLGGALTIEGDALAAKRFLARFQDGLVSPPGEAP